MSFLGLEQIVERLDLVSVFDLNVSLSSRPRQKMSPRLGLERRSLIEMFINNYAFMT